MALADDGELLRGLSRGDEKCFTALYQRRQGAIFRFVLQMSGSAEIAEEVTQEVFLTVIRSAKQWKPERGEVLSWLFGIARNQVLRHLERGRRYETLEVQEEDGASTVRTAPDNPLEELTRGESLEALRAAVLALPPQYREVVVLCDLQELSYEDAAGVLGCPVGTVRSRLHRGRALLVERLRPRVGCST